MTKWEWWIDLFFYGIGSILVFVSIWFMLDITVFEFFRQL